VEGSWEHGNEPSGSIKCWAVLEYLHSWPSRRAQLHEVSHKFCYYITLTASGLKQHRMAGLVNDELERMRKEATVAIPMYYHGICV
jgi:hypothetical protein